MPGPHQAPDLRLADENEKDEEAPDHVEAADESEDNLDVEVAVGHVGVIAVKFDVDALAQPGQAHDEEELGEQDQLLAGVAVALRHAARGDADLAINLTSAVIHRGRGRQEATRRRTKLDQMIAVRPQRRLKGEKVSEFTKNLRMQESSFLAKMSFSRGK